MEHPQLQDAVGALRVRASMEGITFTECANHLSAQVSELPDHQTARKVSAAGSNRSNKGGDTKRLRGGDGPANAKKRNGIHMPDGTVWTGYYSDWSQLSKEDRQKVMDTRQNNKSKVSKHGPAQKLKAIKVQVAELKRTLATLKSNHDDGIDSDNEPSLIPDNAGDAFGGRQHKKAKKE